MEASSTTTFTHLPSTVAWHLSPIFHLFSALKGEEPCLLKLVLVLVLVLARALTLAVVLKAVLAGAVSVSVPLLVPALMLELALCPPFWVVEATRLQKESKVSTWYPCARETEVSPYSNVGTRSRSGVRVSLFP